MTKHLKSIIGVDFNVWHSWFYRWSNLSKDSSSALHLKNMNNQLTHRGPDSHGYWLDQSKKVALGHRRLAIVDLSSAGHQPMTSSSGRYVITYNGEIYNTDVLRAELSNSRFKQVGGGILILKLLLLVLCLGNQRNYLTIDWNVCYGNMGQET